MEEIKNMMKNGFDFDVNTTFTAYTSIDEIEKATEGEINLVLRGEGLKAAKKTLQKEHDMDYYYGKPYGLEGTTLWLRNLQEALGINVNEDYISKKTSEIRKHLMSYRFMIREVTNKSAILVGDYDVVIGLANFIGGIRTFNKENNS